MSRKIRKGQAYSPYYGSGKKLSPRRASGPGCRQVGHRFFPHKWDLSMRGATPAAYRCGRCGFIAEGDIGRLLAAVSSR